MAIRLICKEFEDSIATQLLHNKVGSVPVGHSMKLTESYENLKFVLESLQYSQHNWKICGDLKIISVILGLQAGYT